MTKTLSIIFSGWLVTFFLTLISLQGCIQDDCGPFPIVEFDALMSDVYHVKLDSQSSKYNLLQFNSSIDYSYNEVGVALALQLKPLASLSFGLSSLIACSPPEYYAEVQSFIISSNEKYVEYNAGDDLTEIFDIQEINYGGESINVSKYLSNNSNVMVGFESYLLVMRVPPTTGGTHEFTIQIELIDGTILETTTEKVSITQ
ncbi:MAG: hypothetical protein AB8B73_04455 [Ekhidna sp.]